MRALTTALLLAGAVVVIVTSTSVSLEGVTDTLSPENEKYAQALMDAQAAFVEAQSIYDHDDFYQRRGWRKEHETRDGFSVYSKNTNRGRMFTISEVLDAHAGDVMREMWSNQPASTRARNPLFSSETLAKLGDQADIVRVGAGNGMTMNVVRLYRMVPMGGTTDGYITVMRSVSSPDLPPDSPDTPRLYLGAIRIRPDPVGAGRRTLLDTLVVLDLAGVSDRSNAVQSVSSMLTIMSEQAVRHFGDNYSNYW